MNEAFQTEEKEKFAVQIIETSKQWFRNVSNSELKLEILWAKNWIKKVDKNLK